MRLALGLGLAALLAVACGDDDGPSDGGNVDVGTADTGGEDTGGEDSGEDTGGEDTGGEAGLADGGGSCDTDADCVEGEEWCVEGACVECDNSGLLCDIACAFGWNTYERNGCFPCACAPTNDCTSDDTCEGGGRCEAGEFCWDWCPEGDPSCCYGNVCVSGGCEGPPPVGCARRGCPEGQECQDFETSGVCVSSSCTCADGSWVCTDDCGGGSCAASL